MQWLHILAKSLLILFISFPVYSKNIDKYVKLLEQKTGCILVITSGYRSKKHNKEVGGAPNSYHLYDRARDLILKNKKCTSLTNLYKKACELGLNSILYNDHVHIDDRSNAKCWKVSSILNRNMEYFNHFNYIGEKMTIKTYKEWESEQNSQVTIKEAYEAGVKNASDHFEDNYASTLEYVDQKVRRTSDLNLDIVSKLVEVADFIPEVGQRMKFEELRELEDKLQQLKQAVSDKYAETEPFPRIED